MSGIVNWLSGAPSARDRIAQNLKWSHVKKIDQKGQNIFLNIRDRVLDDACRLGRIEETDVDEVLDFEINLSTKMISYTVPNTHIKESLGFEDIKDATTLGLLKDFSVEAENNLGKTYAAPNSSTNTKGNRKGKTLFNRDTATLKKLPNDFKVMESTVLPVAFDGADPEKRAAILKRHQFAEFYVDKLKIHVEEQIKVKTEERKKILHTGERRQLSLANQEAQLNAEIKHLTATKAKLDNIDVFALSFALSFHPVGQYWGKDLEASASSLAEHAKQQILGHKQTEKTTFQRMRGTQLELNEKDEAYVKDMVGMLYKSRAEYAGYCHSQNIPIKQEGLEDVILREAILFADGIGAPGEVFKKAIHFDEATPKAKQELNTLFEGVGRLTKETVKGSQIDYQQTPYPADATDKQKAEIDQENQQKVALAVTESRKEVNWESSQIPAGSLSLQNKFTIGATAVGVVATVASVATGALTLGGVLRTAAIGASAVSLVKQARSLIPPKSVVAASAVALAAGMYMAPAAVASVASTAYEFARNNPGTVVALGATTVAAGEEILSVVETSSTATERARKPRINKAKIAKMALGVAAVGAAAYMAPAGVVAAIGFGIQKVAETIFTSSWIPQTVAALHIAAPLIGQATGLTLGKTAQKAAVKTSQIVSTIANAGGVMRALPDATEWAKQTRLAQHLPTPTQVSEAAQTVIGKTEQVAAGVTQTLATKVVNVANSLRYWWRGSEPVTGLASVVIDV